MTAAIALRAKGIEARVFERSRVLADVGAGISLWPNAVKALRKIGLGDALDSISLVNEDAVIRTTDGRVFSRVSARDLQQRFGGGVIVAHRAELLQILASSLGAENIHLGHQCTDITQDTNGVTAVFSNSATVQGDFLVGADGLHSIVRASLGHQDPIRYSGYTAWRAVVPFDSRHVAPGESWGYGRRFGALPVRDGRVYWYATSNTPEQAALSNAGPSNRGQKALLQSLFRGWHEPVESLIEAAPDSNILRNDIYDRDPLKAWGESRVTLLGDAAHPMTPNLGQGACQAIEDALELARCLSTTTTLELAREKYEAIRIPRTTSIVLASRRLGAIGQIETPLMCRMRNLAIKLTPRKVSLRSLAPAAGYEGHLVD